MKKVLSMVLVVMMMASLLTGCGTGSSTDDASAGTNAADTSADQSSEATSEDADTTEESKAVEADTPKESDVFYWNIGADPKVLDPCLNGASDGGNVINQTFEGLVREQGGKILPGIAESWETSEDGLTYTFHLRESNWSDGSPLTAEDFVYAWKRGMNPDTASEYAWIWEYTNVVNAFAVVSGEASLDDVGVKALDEKTLEVKLSAPTEYFVSLMSFYHFLPTKKEAVDSGADGIWAKNPDNAVSNGPFVLTNYVIGKGLTLEKNPEYWDKDRVKIQKIEGLFIDDNTTAYQAYQSREIQFLKEPPTAEVPRLLAEDPTFYVFPLLGTYYYNFNLENEVFQDPKVRRAFTLAIDREVICETLGSGQLPATGFAAPGFVDADGNDFAEVAGAYDIAADGSKIEEAQKLLAEAGYPNGEGFPEFTILYNTSENHQAVAELVQEMFKSNLGVNVKLANQEWAVFQDTRREGNYEMARGGWLTDYMDPSGMLSIFTTGNAYNDPSFSNSEYDELLSSSSSTMGKEHFDALYKAQDILMKELPILPVFYYTESYLASDRLKNWKRSVLGTLDFSEAELLPAE